MPKLDPELRNRLEQLIRQGIPDIQIAKKLRISRGTVRSHRRRLVIEDPKGPVVFALRDALRDHWRRLSETARKVADMMSLPDHQIIADGLKPTLELPGPDGVLLRALRDHLREDARGRAFIRREEAAGRLASTIKEALSWVQAKSGGLNAETELTQYFAPAALELCCKRWSLEHRSWDQSWGLQMGGSILARVASEESRNEVKAVLQALVSDLPTTREGGALIDAWDLASKRTDELRKVLWELSVMDGFPGRCSICPILLTNRRP